MSDDSDFTPKGSFDDPELKALSAFVDGELPEAERQAVADRLAADPCAASLVAHYRAQRAALRALFADPVAQTSGPRIVLRVHTPWWRRAALAVCLLAGGAALAWFAGSMSLHFLLPGAQVVFAEQADRAYALYAPEKHHAVEMDATQGEGLNDWLSKRLNRPLAVPSLQEYGYSFLGARLLPGAAGPAAQFMYESQEGGRLALYVSAASQREAPVQLLREGDRRTFYWVSNETGYALSGQIAEDRLRAMAVDVCGELGGHPEKWR